MADDLSDLLEDMSDLDKQILGAGISKESKSFKKNVKFNEQNDDDILGDLLSDDDDIPKKQVPSSKSTRVAELFGIKPQISEISKPNLTKSMISTENKNIESDKSLKNDSEIQRQNTIKSIFTDNDKPAETKSKSLIDSDKTKKSNSDEDFFTTKTRASAKENVSVQNMFEYDSGTGHTSRTNITAEYSPTRKREPRRGRRTNSSIILDDPLGLFSELNNHMQESEKTSVYQTDIVTPSSNVEKSKHESQDFPEWLGGNNQKLKRDSLEPKRTLSAPVSKNSSNADKTTLFQNLSAENIHQNLDGNSKLPEVIPSLNVQADQFSVLSSIQNDVNTVAPLFQQYEQLGRILETQKMKLIEQEKQFDQLVRKQIEGQALLDTQLKMQQGRINNCLQTFLEQSFSSHIKENEKLDKESEAEILLKKLQVEKLQLEKVLESCKKQHEQEIGILDESYKKQIRYLEESLEKVENRLKRDAEVLEENFEIRLQQMKDKMFELEKVHEDEKEQIKMETKKMVQEIHKRCSHNIELIQDEHANTINSISKAKKLEQSAIDLITTHRTDVGKILDNSETAINHLMKLQQQMEEHCNSFFVTKESALKEQENKLEFLKEQFQQERDALEIDRKKFIKITEKFESEVNLAKSDFQSRMSQLIEMENNLKLREKAIIRDRELLAEQTKWEYANIQVCKELWNKEQIKQAEMLAKERENIASERGKLQVQSKFQIQLGEVEKIELESSVKAAKEAMESIGRERKRWQERISELEVQRNVLMEKENQLIKQAKQLDDLTQLALVKKNEGIEALRKARRIEQTYKEKFQQLQIQLQVLEDRENKLAAEKIALARERINLRISEAEMPEKDEKPVKESVNKLYMIDENFSENEHLKPQIQTHFKEIVDPRLLLLKINMNNKLTEYE